jgi:glycosyltransferase involved in cell wall biosynthesis
MTATPGGPSTAGGAAAPRPHPTRLLLVTSLYPTPDRPEAGAFVARRVLALTERGVSVTLIASPSYRNGPWWRHASLALRALTARGRFDGVEGHVLLPASLIALVAARLRRIPLVVYAHGSDVVVAAQRSPLHRWLASLVARGAQRVVTNSADTAAHVAALGVTAAIVPPGVDMQRFRPGDRAAVRARLAIDAGDRVALFVGSLDARKGADVFAEAIEGASAWHGIMLGAGPLGPPITSDHPGIRVVRPVPPDDVPNWMVAADVVVVPSRREPLGLAAVEALASGTPVIASAVGGLIGVVQDGINGLLVPAGDAALVTLALERLTDEGLRSALAAAARASVAAHDLAAVTSEMGRIWSALGVDA